MNAAPRGHLLTALATVVALGLVSRLYPMGVRWFDKDLGDALYAVAAYLVLALACPRWPPASPSSPWPSALPSRPSS